MWNYKIAMATFRTSQCQDGDEVLKCREWRCQGTKNATQENIKKDSNRYFGEKVWKLGLIGLKAREIIRIWTKRAWNYHL